MRTLAAVRKAPSAARPLRGPRGFTLAEVLIATAFIMVAFGSVGIGFLRGTSSVETGRQQTTALYLAEQRLEQIKAWSLSTVATQGFASVAAGAGCCRSEGYNTIADYGNYRRTVTVTSNGATTKVLLVSVFYFPVNPSGGHAGNERRVDVSTLITNR